MKTNFVSAKKCRKGFTLVELLVVIAIIGILIALLLPAVQAAREAARRSQCSNNMKQIGLALHNYHDSFKAFPMAMFIDAVTAAPRMNGASWGMAILPYMEQQALYDQFDHNVGAADQLSPANVNVIATPVAGFVCPSAPGGIDREYVGDGTMESFPLTWRAAPSDYMATEVIHSGVRRLSGDLTLPNGEGVLAEWGNGTGTGDNRKSSFSTVKDGTSNTFIVGERTGGNEIYNGSQVVDLTGFPFTKAQIVGANGGGWGDILNGECDFGGALHSGIDATMSHGGRTCLINCTNAREYSFHSFHPGGATFLMADGSVQFITETINPGTFAAMYTQNGGEVVPD